MLTQHINSISNNAPAVTYGGSAATLVVWGLHWPDIAAIGGLLIGFCGLMLQFYMAFRRIQAVEQQQVAQTITSAGNTNRIQAVEVKVDDQKGLVRKEMTRQDAASAVVESRVTRGEADQAATQKVVTAVAGAVRAADKNQKG